MIYSSIKGGKKWQLLSKRELKTRVRYQPGNELTGNGRAPSCAEQLDWNYDVPDQSVFKTSTPLPCVWCPIEASRKHFFRGITRLELSWNETQWEQPQGCTEIPRDFDNKTVVLTKPQLYQCPCHVVHALFWTVRVHTLQIPERNWIKDRQDVKKKQHTKCQITRKILNECKWKEWQHKKMKRAAIER